MAVKQLTFISRRRRKRNYIKLKNRCNQKTHKLGIEWLTEQHSFNFGQAIVRYPLRDGQLCIALKIQTADFVANNKSNQAANDLLLTGNERTAFIDQISCLIKGNHQESEINIMVNPTGLIATINIGKMSLNLDSISNIIEQTYPTICHYLIKFRK